MYWHRRCASLPASQVTDDQQYCIEITRSQRCLSWENWNNWAKIKCKADADVMLLWSTNTIQAAKEPDSVFFSPLGELTGRAIYFACVNFFVLFFFLFISFLMIFRRTIMSGYARPIFAIFSPLFYNISRDVATATNFVEKMANSSHSSLWHSEMEWDIATSVCALTA